MGKAIDVVTTLNRNGTNLSDDSSQPANAKEELIEDMKDEMKDKLEISEDISENFRIERDSSKSCNGEVSEVNNATNSRNSVELKVCTGMNAVSVSAKESKVCQFLAFIGCN